MMWATLSRINPLWKQRPYFIGLRYWTVDLSKFISTTEFVFPWLVLPPKMKMDDPELGLARVRNPSSPW